MCGRSDAATHLSDAATGHGASYGDAFRSSALWPETSFQGAVGRYPRIRPDWQFDSRQVDLIAERFDAAIGGGFDLAPGVISHALAPLHLIAVASPDYMKGRSILAHDCILIDISERGVRVHIAGFDVPDEFVLVQSGDGVVRESKYKVVWRRGHEVGAESERFRNLSKFCCRTL